MDHISSLSMFVGRITRVKYLSYWLIKFLPKGKKRGQMQLIKSFQKREEDHLACFKGRYTGSLGTGEHRR